MNTTELTYPVFKANQVLTDAPLNDMFEYLDEQTRLTRANLIGVGIACGLDVELTAPDTIHLTKGVGVTTQGYLVVEPKDVDLVAVRKYVLPAEYGYAPFMETDTRQYPLWELFPNDDEPDAETLVDSGLVLNDMALLLFLELRQDGLGNCSPNNCDDRGAEVSATLRRLLIDTADLDKMIAAAGSSADGLVTTDLATVIATRLKLPDLRMPRFDVPNSGPVSTEAVLAAFQSAFRQDKIAIAADTAAALSALYKAFEPLVAGEYPNDPFATFGNMFGFLDANPVKTVQVRFMQYYWDLFDDLLAAYDEVRWKGVDLMCVCCPPDGLFPRHLMTGLLDPSQHSDPARCRHHFVPSPAVGDCEDRAAELLILFRRLVAMVASFTEEPSLAAATTVGPDPQIRITPSRWGHVPLSAKAIPYYYRHNGTPPLYELWDPEKTARRRANQNLSYRADEYQPAPPPFVAQPLRFDLEPHNFLRIEGHLGKNVQGVLQTLLSLKKSHRLPIDVIALRTGAFDENIAVDLSKERCRFDDLEALYDTLRTKLICFLVKHVVYFYDIPHDHEGTHWTAASKLELLKVHAPDYRVKANTMGSWIEDAMTLVADEALPIGDPAIALKSFTNHVYRLVGVLASMVYPLGDDLAQLDLTLLAGHHEFMVRFARTFEAARAAHAPIAAPFARPGLAEHLAEIVSGCRLDALEALVEEYKRRILDVKQAQFLSHFLERHPGVQHKAGVPLGGTFILVYHELPRPALGSGINLLIDAATTGRIVGAAGLEVGEAPDIGLVTHTGAHVDVGGTPDTTAAAAIAPGAAGVVAEMSRYASTSGLDDVTRKQVSEALAHMSYKQLLTEDPDVQLLYKVITGHVLVSRFARTSVADATYLKAVSELANGAVIADFFVPYQCHSSCSPIQYTLPPVHLRVGAAKGCTNADGLAEVTLGVDGATGAVSVQVDGGPFEESTGKLLLGVGDHSIVARDDTGAQSSPVTVIIPPQLTIDGADRIVDESAGTWQVTFTVAGGTPPYVADIGDVVGATYTGPPRAIGETQKITVTDAAGCSTEDTFESGVEQCTLPCDGAAEKRGFRFWLPEVLPNFPLHEYRANVPEFVIIDPGGNETDLKGRVLQIVNSFPDPIPSGDFPRVVQSWLDAINALVTRRVGSDQWFNLTYEAAEEGATTGTLWVDRITCIGFRFQLDIEFTQGRRGRPHRFQIAYEPQGTSVTDHITDSDAFVPPFGGSTFNKCRPWEPPVPECDGSELELVIERQGIASEPIVLSAVASEEPALYLWEVQDARPPLANGRDVVVTFDPQDSAEKLVRLTAFTDRGCVTTARKVINIFEIHG